MFDVRDSTDEGLEDRDLFIRAQKENALFVTTDKDFFHTIPKTAGDHFGIFGIALRQPNYTAITEKLIWAINNFDLNNMRNKVILLRDLGYSVIDR
ncbi:MAG: DUF5615 family PIN-like protein [Ignavibacteriaceae bacterium]|nr:DUF5615 family PIN-like protein [Ignavibacteriaceae bacterium]